MCRFKQFIQLSVLSCLLILNNGVSAETITYSLPDLIDMALGNNPQVEIARQQSFQVEGVLTQSKSVYLPHLALGLGVSQIHVDNLEPEDDDTVGLGTVSASQLIYDFGRATGRIDVSRYSLEAAKANLLQQIDNINFDIQEAYYSILEKKQLIKVAEEAVASYVLLLDRAEKYFKAGVRTRIDVTNAQVELSNAKLELLRANSNLKTARAKLERILGLKPNMGDYIVLSDSTKLEELAAGKPKMDTPFPDLLEDAKQFRPGLKQAKALVQASSAGLTEAKGDYFPTINATGSYDAYETDLTSLPDQWQLGVGLSWEFFSGFETEGKVAEANSKVLEQQAALRNLELAITQQVTDSYLNAEQNREGVDLANETLGLAWENLTLAEGRYKAGINDIIEYNDAQLTYTRSQSNLVVIYYAYLIDLARIELAKGTITNESK